MVASPAILGERNVVITAETNNSVIITGDGNTVHLHQTSEGALLEHEFRWNRPRPRARDDLPLAPPRFGRHVDRSDEIRSLVGDGASPRLVNVYGSQGVGKTYLLVEALNQPDAQMPDGTIYLDARGRDAGDILHAIFEELFDSPVPIRDLRVERHLSKSRALVAIEDTELEAADAQRLALAAPRCRLLVTSRQRVLFDGVAVQLEGLAAEYAATIAEQELGRPLTGSERAAAAAVGGALRGNPLQLRQTFNRVRETGLALEALAPRAASAAERDAELSAPQRDVARTLAVHGTAPLGLEHIEALAGGSAAATAARELEARHDARSYSPRYSLVGSLAEAFAELDQDIDRALDHFIGWAESEAAAGRRDRVLEEGAALVELLGRAHRAGRHAEVVRLGIAVEWSFAWGNRWTAWGTVLDLVLASARASANRWAEGWALHQLGTREYGLGNAPGAVTQLERALSLRERTGDPAGAAATLHNLDVARRRAPLPYRLSHLPLVVVAIMMALLVGVAGVAGAQIAGGDEGGGAGGAGGDAARPTLTLSVVGKGEVASGGGSIRCAKARCREELDRGTRVLLRTESEPGWQFSRWRGACTGRGPCRLVVQTDASVSALFKRVSDPRGVSVSVEGSGTVVSYPAGIRCGTDERCAATFKRSGEVQLTAAAARGHRFAGWSGACDGDGRCVIAGDARSVAVTARFVADGDARSLTVVLGGAGHGRVVSSRSGIDCGEVCAASYTAGTRLVLRATPQPGSSFPGWNDPACEASTADTCTIALERTRSVTARFDRSGSSPQPQAHDLTVLVQGKGTVSSDPAGIESCDSSCTEALPEGDVVLTSSPGQGYRIGRWEGACADTQADVCTVTLDRPLTALAIFVPDGFSRDRQPARPRPSTTTTTPTTPTTPTTTTPATRTLTTRVTGDPAGRIVPDCPAGCPYPDGAQVTLSASSANPYAPFYQWVSGCPGSQSATCTITMDADRTVSAEFAG